MTLPPDPAGAPRRPLPVWRHPTWLTVAAVVVGWISGNFRYAGALAPSLLGGVLATLLGILAWRTGRDITARRQARLQEALEAAARRNEELEKLSHLATVLLGGEATADLQREVASAASELLRADGSVVMLLGEQGRFLRVVAANGILEGRLGQLAPVDRSIAGWVVTQNAPLTLDHPSRDPRNFLPPNAEEDFASLASVPLRSAGVVIGCVIVYTKAGGRQLGAKDLQTLQALGEIVVIGLDRAAMLEETLRNEQVLAQKNRELVRADQLKSQFVTNMSHELRTPLNAIIGFSDLILAGGTGEVNEMQQDFLESVARNGRHLLGLINNILDLSKIEAGRMQLGLGTVDLNDVIVGAVTDTASLRSAKRQACTVEIAEGEDFRVTADGVRIRQVLYNLLANASKFTGDDGCIALRAVRARVPLPVPHDRTTDSGEVRLIARDAVWIAVTDTGVGIRSEDRDKLFKEFGQLDTELNRQHQGTGLGLSLCKSFVELHGGLIGAESVYEIGSSFWFIVPVEGPIRRSTAAAVLPATAAAAG